MHLRIAMLYVKNMERMRRFYSEALGNHPSEQHSTECWCVFESGAAQLALHSIPAEMADDIEIDVPAVPREDNPVKLIFEVEDLEEARARLESHGAQVLQRTWQKPGEACDLADPEGNIFQLAAYRNDK